MSTSRDQKTIQSYLLGFFLSLLLTLLAFAMVEMHLLTSANLYMSLAGLAILQLLVQSTCFLRLNSSHDGRWNLLPFLFTIFIIVILAGGTLWIMYNLNDNMM
jgi:cytochrome o ubiquinol oxidase operon protein cyoD